MVSRDRLATGFCLVASAAALAVLGGAAAAPWLATRAPVAEPWLRFAYAPLCHQLADRSLSWAGSPWALCARCTGLYLGASVGIVLAALNGRAFHGRRWMVAAVAPTALDGLLAVLGWSPLGNLSRLALAIPAGAIAGILLALALRDLTRNGAATR